MYLPEYYEGILFDKHASRVTHSRLCNWRTVPLVRTVSFTLDRKVSLKRDLRFADRVD